MPFEREQEDVWAGRDSTSCSVLRTGVEGSAGTVSFPWPPTCESWEPGSADKKVLGQRLQPAELRGRLDPASKERKERKKKKKKKLGTRQGRLSWVN